MGYEKIAIFDDNLGKGSCRNIAMTFVMEKLGMVLLPDGEEF